MKNNTLLIQLKSVYYLKKQFGGSKKTSKKWATLSHNGVLFLPSYIPHKIPLQIKKTGEKIILSPLAEEMITIYSKYIDTEYPKNSKFNKNFWNDWKKLLSKENQTKITSLEDCDYSLIYKHFMKEKENKKSVSKEKKEADKTKRDLDEKKYKTAMVDGKPQPVGNYRMEPSGIFIGRGCHPKIGKIKPRTEPEDVIINIGKGEKVPELPSGRKWNKVIHDKNVEWLASWKDPIAGKIKYVWLASHSDLRAKNDKEKFDLAWKLKKKIKSIREENDKNLNNSDKKIRQIATALYFIDSLALRVGNERGADEADTVGVTSLRIEHVELLENLIIKLNFLGKDSVKYVNKVKVPEIIYNNIKDFMKDKGKNDELFDLINSNDVNKYLQSLMKGLTAKVFRTFNASYYFYKDLKKISQKYSDYSKDDKINILLDEFNKANARVAILCNHQKNVSKGFNDQVIKINDQIKELKNKLKKYTEQNTESSKEKAEKVRIKLKSLKAKKQIKIELKSVALGTSKINYIDPRITVSFMKQNKIPLDKVFSKSLIEKFNWAIADDTIPV